MKFLCSEVDDETDCLHILHGDWNDAIDRLGRTKKEGKDFGNGVSVMATLQMYRNCRELVEILETIGGYNELISEYNNIKKTVFCKHRF